ncbi:Small glutamine-rich tetratricopeptide repeat-containing protein 2 [Smittium mucronatum]|uniref:Small glutamine-rich tetratricopeptide repeat-containing protein 2 n=1 Tax=Smittium mucronatum TaxID=133383 RepID=A0A1R0GZD3_9FUNG|nr:Small glutamine-rich tetratricopeptide repeat-containing protein 2 [Smittium mucronatum]
MSDNSKLLASGIVNFLDNEIHSSALDSEAVESIEVAKQCILDAFQLSEDSVVEGHDFNKTSLLEILELYKSGNINKSAGNQISNSKPSETPKIDKALAEEHKTKGNSLMSKKDYAGAVEEYGNAIAIDSTNAIYYANRSAAQCQLKNMKEALSDAQMAIDIDPTYSKAYSRLGHAYYGLGEFSEAANAYRDALKYDPTNDSTRAFLASCEAKLIETEGSRDVGSGSQAPLGPGMPDLSALMNNPALASMAKNLMGSGALDQILKNPEMSKLAEGFQKTGKMPSLETLMSTPGIKDMASKFAPQAGGSTPTQDNSDPSQKQDPLSEMMKNPDIMKMASQFMQGQKK